MTTKINKGDILFVSNDHMVEHWFKVDDITPEGYIEVTSGVSLIKQPTQEGLVVIPLQLFGINGNEPVLEGGTNPIYVNLSSFAIWGKLKSKNCLDRFTGYTSAVKPAEGSINDAKKAIIGA